MTVVQKQPKTISADELFTEDADTQAAEIVYDVMNMPTNGRLVSAENITYPRSQVTHTHIKSDHFHRNLNQYVCHKVVVLNLVS